MKDKQADVLSRLRKLAFDLHHRTRNARLIEILRRATRMAHLMTVVPSPRNKKAKLLSPRRD
jgi:hypothetical protein